MTKQQAAEKFCKKMTDKRYKISSQTLDKVMLFANQYELTEDDFIKFCVGQKLTNTSYNRIKPVFNKFFLFCIDEGIISINPISSAAEQKIEASFPRKKTIYTKEEIIKACNFYVEGKKYVEALIVYSLFEGITVEELAEVKKSDLKTKNVILPTRMFKIDKFHRELFGKVANSKLGFFYNNKSGKLSQVRLRDSDFIIRYIDNEQHPTNAEERVIKLRRKLFYEGFSKLILRDSGLVYYSKQNATDICEKYQMSQAQIKRIVHSYDSLREA